MKLDFTNDENLNLMRHNRYHVGKSNAKLYVNKKYTIPEAFLRVQLFPNK